MIFIDINKGNRLILPQKQRDFLVKAVTFSWYLYNQILSKATFFYGNELKISSTLLLADLLIKSEFGDHPLSQVKYPLKDGGKWANNLMQMELDEYWNNKFLKYSDGRFYKSFKTWEEFGVHFSDTIIFHKGKIDPYLMKNLTTKAYNGDSLKLIHNYDLEEFEIGEA